jgi:hypothetical protein
MRGLHMPERRIIMTTRALAQRCLGLVVALTLAITGVACSSAGSATPGTANPSDIVSLDVSSSLVVVRKGESKTLRATVTLADGTKKDVTGDVEWKSDNPSTATVTEHGTVVGAGPGITTVTVTYKDQSTSAKITVMP